MASTKIEWTDASWNPIRGCSRVSEGCRNCYAERQAARFSGKGQAYEGLVRITNAHPQWTGKVVFDEKKLLEPLSWIKPRRVFVNSMSDLFHPEVTDVQLDLIFSIMRVCPHITFQVLTKRPERMREYLSFPSTQNQVAAASQQWARWKRPHRYDNAPWPLQNVWCGISVEDQETADERIPLLLETPAAVRWISAEPLLGPINLPERCFVCPANEPHPICPCLDWIVVGGESGPGARPMHPDWARALREQCLQYSVPFFFKQWGDWAPSPGKCFYKGPIPEFRKPNEMGLVRLGKKTAGRLLDGALWDEFPEFLYA